MRCNDFPIGEITSHVFDLEKSGDEQLWYEITNRKVLNKCIGFFKILKSNTFLIDGQA